MAAHKKDIEAKRAKKGRENNDKCNDGYSDIVQHDVPPG
jgi:hypothetical protein